MASTCLYTLEPLERGGVIAKVREVVAIHSNYGHEVRLLYTATEQVPAAGRADKLRHFWRARPQWQTRCGLTGFAVPDWPMPLWASYAMPLLAARHLIGESDMHVAVSGSNHCALPAALSREIFIVWIGTLYGEELLGRARAGDRWARRILSSPARHLLAWEEKVIFERAALILTNGTHTADSVRRVYPAVADRIRVVIYPVDTNIFRPDSMARRGDTHRYLLFTARINDPRKNIGMLFRAFALVRASMPTLRLVLTGDSPLRSVLRSVEENGIADAVDFVGQQSLHSLIKLYQGADLFVLPSLQEGLGISMLEAMACGLPVVSTRCGGPETIIRDGETGRLVENNDERAFADAILHLLANPAQLEAMRSRCTDFARANFSREVVENQLVGAFRTVYPQYFP